MTRAALSRFNFCTAFRLVKGHTRHEWPGLLIEQARRPLAHLELAVTEVAQEVRYETTSSFAAAFRKVTGTSPTTFRRTI
jgi:AraC family transcriptional regulator